MPCRSQFQSEKSIFLRHPCRHEKLQLIKRLPAPIIRHLLASHRTGELSARQTAHELGLSRPRFYRLYSNYLRACARGEAELWSPGVSGGDHYPQWPGTVTDLLTRLLSSRPPSSYSAAACEIHRRLDFKTDRASVRRWAIQNQLAPDTRYKQKPLPVKRWQVRDLGALWQYDASPHCFLPHSKHKQTLLNLLDDATRYNVGARLYHGETLLTHLDFLDRSFRAHGLPLALYVDHHSFFFAHAEAFTQLGAALHFYGVALRYAPTPQAKGKIERRHQYFQNRLPPLFAADKITDVESANMLMEKTLAHANQHEIHRELGTTPEAARKQALLEKRSVLRPAPKCPWWPYVWSQQTRVRVGDDGKVPVGTLRQSINASPRSKVIRCLRHDGDLFFLQLPPDQKTKPIVLLHCPPF